MSLTISEVSRLVGLRPSTIRYYEQIGILRPPLRKSGQRRYDASALRRLAIIQRAQQTGFTLAEIRELLFGFAEGTQPSRRWKDMSRRKLIELDDLIERIEQMKNLLTRLQRCNCAALDECGKRILQHRGIVL